MAMYKKKNRLYRFFLMYTSIEPVVLSHEKNYFLLINMLGEIIGELKGKVTGQRVVSPEGRSETSVQETGKLLGTEVNQIVTFWVEARKNGLPYGEGLGNITTRDGEMATWTAQAVFRPLGQGAITGIGSLFVQTSSRKLERLNSIVVLFEVNVDGNGNTHAKFWEWK